jgi:hypothetical protein
MGTFHETANVIYHLSSADKENKLPFSISVCSKQMEVPISVSSAFHVYTENGVIYINTYICEYIYIYIYCHFKRKTEGRGFFLNSLNACSLSVCWRRNKRKLSVCKQTKRTKGTCPSIPRYKWKCGSEDVTYIL